MSRLGAVALFRRTDDDPPLLEAPFVPVVLEAAS